MACILVEGAWQIVYLFDMATQPTSREHAPPIETFRIRAGWLIDGSGGPAERDVILEIGGGCILTIDGPGMHGTPGQDVKDLSSCTILPVLADAHVHLFMSGAPQAEVREAQLSASYDALEGVIARHLRAHLSCGVLAVRDGGDYGGFALRYKEEILRTSSPEMQVRCAGKAWRAEGRYGRLIGRSPQPGETLGQAIARCQDPVDHVKIVNSGINSLKVLGRQTPPQFTPGELKAAAAVCKDLGLPMMVHANGREPVASAIEGGCDSIEHGFFMGRENLERMADLGIFWVPTAYTMEAYANTLDPLSTESGVARQTLEHQIAQMAQAREFGIRVALGTDCGSLGVHHGAAVREELRLFMQAGYSIEEAVQCATSHAARLLRSEGAFGRLAPGMPASFLVVRGGPKELPRTLEKIEGICAGGVWIGFSG